MTHPHHRTGTFHKILIANRGEIACRVIRSARALGYRTVAVYSDADAEAPHVALANEALRIGPPAADSYLNIAALLDAARRTGADAVHPGYGFLSERADFAQACAEAGLVFIGPPPGAIEAMGDKAGAKRRMIAAGVPCAPGYLAQDPDGQTDERLRAEAERLGLPLLVKAVAGGGGRGMRLVQQFSELPEALRSARREAENAFGDGTLMLERLITGGRHIEIQIFADAHGHAVHLGERDCTAQRRRQKVIEEAPSPIVNPVMRAAMGADAVAAALAVGYVGAGTVEFIVDEHLNHYFLEMNTRLQVEHPVTECVTGFDLVEWQLRVAAGEPLSAWLPGGQADVTLRGHAIELRLYAEDPYDGFRPQTGTVLHWAPEAAVAAGRSPGQAWSSARVDDGIRSGSVVSPWYDAMLAKLIVHGHDRADALRRAGALLDDAPLLGLRSNRAYLRALLQQEDFVQGRMTTSRLDEWAATGHPVMQRPEPTEADWAIAAAAFAQRSAAGGAPTAGPGSAGLRPAAIASQGLQLRCNGQSRHWRQQWRGDTVHLQPTDPLGQAQGTPLQVRLLAAAGTTGTAAPAELPAEVDGLRTRRVRVWEADALHEGPRLHLASGPGGAAESFVFEEPGAAPSGRTEADPAQLRAPVAGTVVSLGVQPGDRVTAGQPLVCVEAMKMEMWQAARCDGVVAAAHVAPRDAVRAGALLITLTPDAAAG